MHTETPAPLADKLYDELDDAQREALDSQKQVQPTAEEARNGWTAETLTEYLASRVAGQSLSIDVNSLHRRVARRPQTQNCQYRPLRWRG